MSQTSKVFTTDVPARLDRLPFSRFHWLVAAALSVTWILDGLEMTLVASLSPAISASLPLTPVQLGLAGAAYIVGAVLGALVFGRLTDTYGRRRLFTLTAGVYLVATLATGFAWDPWSFIVFRFITGAGIGGEYGAISSAIQELIPARRRGYAHVAVHGSAWIGVGLGAMASIAVLDPGLIDQQLGWRLAFIIGGLLAIIVIVARRFIPESPRWLMTHGREAEAETVVREIEARIERETALPPVFYPPARIRLRRRGRAGLLEIAAILLRRYPRRTVLCLVLMATQAFFYTAIFFSYAQVLTGFYGVEPADVGWFMLPFALGNVAGPLLLGRMFDSVGRRTMITGCYAAAGVLLLLTAWLVANHLLTAETQTAMWMVIFVFASTGASAAYLTAGELFPLEIRAVTISLFYAVGALVGGASGPLVFAMLVASGTAAAIASGYVLGGSLMLVGAATMLALGVKAERRPLEDLAPPLSLAPEPVPSKAPLGA